MSSFPYMIRNYQPQDFNSYIHLCAEAKAKGHTEDCASPQVMREHLSRPNFSPEQDLFVIETDDHVVGYLDITPEIQIGRVILDCLMHPKHRRKGLATRLFACATHRASELDVSVAHVTILKDNSTAASLLSKLGFQPVRRYLELRLILSDVDFPDVGPEAYRHMKRGEEDKLARLQNLSFGDSWGYNPNTVDDITYYTNLTNSYPEDVIWACEDDNPIAYCWTQMEPSKDKTEKEAWGRIYMIGVDPAYRGRGIGRKVLLAGLRYFKSKGVETVELTTDSENAAACALYHSLGFKVRASSLWYEKSLR